MNPLTLSFKNFKMEAKYEKMQIKSKLFFIKLTLLIGSFSYCLVFLLMLFHYENISKLLAI